jgi:hypothetical protein
MTRYTNLVLTVIAVALTVIAIENLVHPSRADPAPSVQPVTLCDAVSKYCLDVNRDMHGSFIQVVPRQPWTVM